MTQLLLITEQHRAISHYVTDDEALGPLQGRDPRAICGRVFLPAGLTAPLGVRCPECIAAVTPAQLPRIDRRRQIAALLLRARARGRR